jgi:CBS domain-containing protein
MNVLAPVSTSMTSKLITVNPKDTLKRVKEIFDKNNIHHVPVVRYKKIVGIVSKTDFMHFLHGFVHNDMDKHLSESRLNAWKVEEIMTNGLAKVDSKEPIRTVLEIFKLNHFHAIPVVENGELVGIVTTYDIIKKLADEPIHLDDYKTANV